MQILSKSNPQVQRLNRHHRPMQILLSRLPYSQAVNALFSLQKNGAVLVVASSGLSKTTQLRIWAVDEEDSILDKRGYIIPVEAGVQ